MKMLSNAEKETKVMSKAKDDHYYFCKRNKKQDGKSKHKHSLEENKMQGELSLLMKEMF